MLLFVSKLLDMYCYQGNMTLLFNVDVYHRHQGPDTMV